MRKISFWARRNPWPSRLLIGFVLYPLLNLCGWLLGNLLAEGGSVVSPWLFYLTGIAVILICLVYGSRQWGYYRRKLLEGSMAVCTFVLVTLAVNSHVTRSTIPTLMPVGYSYGSTVLNPEPKPAARKAGVFKKVFLFFKGLFGKRPDGNQTGAIVAVILLALLLAVGLTALCCDLACNGAEAAAIVVGILGGAGIILGAYFAIRAIKKRKSAG